MDPFLNRSKGVTFQKPRLQLDDRCLISGRPTTALPVRTTRSRAYPPPPRRRRRNLFGAAAGDCVLAGPRVLLFSSLLRVRDLAAFAVVLRSVRAPGLDGLAHLAPALVDSSEEGGAGAVVGTTGNFNRIQFERASWCLLCLEAAASTGRHERAAHAVSRLIQPSHSAPNGSRGL